MPDLNETGAGKNHLFRDSKLGVIVTGLLTVGFDAVLDAGIEGLTNVDTSGWNGWWTTVASAALATAVGALTAYKAKRHAHNDL
jgi:fructose-specific phosphotransferase system IIC component